MIPQNTIPGSVAQRPLRVAVLVDLPRTAHSGGHVKGWESRAYALARTDLPVELTVFFSGPEKTEWIAPHVCLRQLPPVFSTKNLRFLPYVPDYTDLAPYHPALARALKHYDVIHTTDAYFAFARTAERVSRKYKIPLVKSFHTDTPSYARVFTRNAIDTIFRKSWFARFLNDTCRFPEKQEQKMLRRLRSHLACCQEALLVRPEDAREVENVLGKQHAHSLKIVSNKNVFCPSKANRADLCKEYGIPEDRLLALFVGRIDIGKNIYTLLEALETLVAKGLPVHLIAAGKGPAEEDLKKRLGDHVTLTGFIDQTALSRVMASCDLFTFPSEIEIRSFVSVEALSAGLPVLVAAKSGIAELIPAQGALIPVFGGSDAWAQALLPLIHDRGLVQLMHEKAVSFAEKHIVTWEESLALDFLPVWQKAFDNSRGHK